MPSPWHSGARAAVEGVCPSSWQICCDVALASDGRAHRTTGLVWLCVCVCVCVCVYVCVCMCVCCV